MNAATERQAYRILVYGHDLRGFLSRGMSRQRNTNWNSGSGKRHRGFQDFDGVIVFQGSFEQLEPVPGRYGGARTRRWDRDELDKRTKEVLAVLEGRGLVCLLLADPISDLDDTDLSKRLLLRFQIMPGAFINRVPLVKSKVDELANFFQRYGAAWSFLSPPYGDKAAKTVASVGGRPVSVVVDGSLFLMPTLLPDPTDEATEEYYRILADGVVSLWERLAQDLPEWAAEYRFPDEAGLLEAKLRLSNEISGIEQRLKDLERLKRVLVLQGEPLVDAVIEVFEKMLPLKPKREEAFREDLTLLDSGGNVVALVEVKGVNRGVGREQVNQADSHRERKRLPSDFPSLLIVNTHMKASSSVTDKDQRIAPEQTQHAARNNILVLRTLDLLNLASLHASGRLSAQEVVKLLTKSRGWLRVADTAEVLVE